MSPVLKLVGEDGVFNGSMGGRRGPIFESNPPQVRPSISIYLRYLYSPLCTRTPSVVVSCGSKIFYFPHSSLSRSISSRKNFNIIQPLPYVSSFVLFRVFKISIQTIHYRYTQLQIPIEASTNFIYTVHTYVYVHIILFITCVELNFVVLMSALLFAFQEAFGSNFRQEPIKFQM